MSEDPFAGSVNYGEFTFRVKRWVISSLADAAAAALPGSAAIPALKCFRLRVGEGFLELAATDMERTVLAESQAVDCQHPGDGTYFEAFVPAKKLQAILKEAPETDVTVEVKANQATVTAGGSWVLILPDSSDYPELLSPGQLEFGTCSREKFLAALRSVRHVVCKDAGQPLFTQVDIRKLDEEDTWAAVTATDGPRFARTQLDGFPAEMRIPASALDDLGRLLAGAESDEAGIAVTEDVLAFKAGPAILAVQRRSTPFPDVDRLLLEPAMENDQVLTVDRDELVTAVRRVRINAESATSAIVLEVGEGSVSVVSKDKAGNSASEGIIATWAGKERVICVNHVFLMEMLAAHSGKTCEFRLGKDVGKRRSQILLAGDGIVQIMSQMTPGLVGY